jgi:hypothetical protein
MCDDERIKRFEHGIRVANIRIAELEEENKSLREDLRDSEYARLEYKSWYDALVGAR